MLDQITNTQRMADLLKSIVLDAGGAEKDDRMQTLSAISKLERCGWHRGMMHRAIADAAPHIESGDDGFSIPGSDAEKLAAIRAVITRYLEIFGYDEVDSNRVYTMQEAADYLDISKAMMETYVIRRGEIPGEKIGRSWVFTKETLDHFKRSKRPKGRPPAESP
ncbi:MAG: helix-turn-helix domain-containing protein [Chloroflexota bacterium]